VKSESTAKKTREGLQAHVIHDGFGVLAWHLRPTTVSTKRQAALQMQQVVLYD
jgi:hypothetical protein